MINATALVSDNNKTQFYTRCERVRTRAFCMTVVSMKCILFLNLSQLKINFISRTKTTNF